MKRSLTIAALIALCLLPASAAQARDVTIKSFDGTPLIAHFYPAKGPRAGKKAPTILIGHGWGGSGEAASGTPAPFIAAGYNVLTWDARGFGGSGGTVEIDSPDYEGRDVRSLIDYVARQPEAQLDKKGKKRKHGKHGKPGDPRVGMSGGSYGGGIQLLGAALDKRIDAITPTIAWNDLPSSLYPHDSLKIGWDLALVGLGIPTSVAQGVLSPAGIQAGNQSPQFYDTVVNGTATGILPPDDVHFFAHNGPDYLLHKIKAPTLIAQGTVDTLFTLDQGNRNYRSLSHNGIPLKMMWFCGGHGICNVDSDGSSVIGDSAQVQKRRLQWFSRYLKGHRKQKTGPAFEWTDQNAHWHASGAYPVKTTGKLKARAANKTVALVPGLNPTSGFLVAANPDPTALTVPIPSPARKKVVGPPRLKLTYKATGVSTTRNDGATHLFAQIVDRSRNVVVGNQATPIKVRLDGKQHAISRKLVRIASLSTKKGYSLQIVDQSNLYDAQRAAGAVQLSKIAISLPTTKPRPKHRRHRGHHRGHHHR